MLYNNYFIAPMPFIPSNCEKPPTIYSILESIVNYGTDEKTKIKDLASVGRTTIFDFDYPLSSNVPRETFETLILNHFLMRRIGFDTVRAFQIQLMVKLNSIMPMYNKMFDLLHDTNYLGDVKVREGINNKIGNSESNSENTLNNESTNTTNNTSDNRYSDTPQSKLQNLRDGSYVTDYRYVQDSATSNDKSKSEGKGKTTSNDTENTNYKETETNINTLDTLFKLNEKTNNIYEMIFKDLDCLFYQLI